jgi:hypothetical protein
VTATFDASKSLVDTATILDTMKIFISWSGPRSGAVAEALKEYLPVINNSFEPWLSSDDIPKGSRSTAEIADALAMAGAGIICLTLNNLKEPWILYEAGGVAKTVEKPLACTLLIDLEPSEVGKPLGDFQHTRLKDPKLREKQLLQLVRTLNKALKAAAREDAQLVKAFNLCWPELKERFEKLPKDGPSDPHHRPEGEVLEELVATVKYLSEKIEKLETAMRPSLLGADWGLPNLNALRAYAIPFDSSSGSATGPTGPTGPQGPMGYGEIIRARPGGGFIQVENPVVPRSSPQSIPSVQDAPKSGAEETARKKK